MTTTISATIHMIANFEVKVQNLESCATVNIGPEWLGSSEISMFLRNDEEAAIIERAFLTVKGIRHAAVIDEDADAKEATTFAAICSAAREERAATTQIGDVRFAATPTILNSIIEK